MSRRYVNQLAHGDAIDEIFLIADKQVRANRQGNNYLLLDLRDKTGVIAARLWNVNDDLARQFDHGGYLRARGKVQLFQGALQMILAQIEPVAACLVEPAEFLAAGPPDLDRMIAKLRGALMGLDNPALRALAECFLIDDDFLTRFTAAPAGVRHHHAYRGGLLEHVVTMLTAAQRIADLYPELDRDVLLMGVFLHDIGKIDELSYDQGAFAYTDEGQLVGHLVMGVALRAKIEKSTELTGERFPVELRLRLEHMIVSHHGSHEFGSPKLPMTPEAIALNCLDNLDSKLHVFLREIRDDPSRGSTWTPFNQNLGRRLFKGVPAEANGAIDE